MKAGQAAEAPEILQEQSWRRVNTNSSASQCTNVYDGYTLENKP